MTSSTFASQANEVAQWISSLWTKENMDDNVSVLSGDSAATGQKSVFSWTQRKASTAHDGLGSIWSIPADEHQASVAGDERSVASNLSRGSSSYSLFSSASQHNAGVGGKRMSWKASVEKMLPSRTGSKKELVLSELADLNLSNNGHNASGISLKDAGQSLADGQTPTAKL